MYSVELRALIVSPDTGTAAILVRLFRDLCVRAHVCADQTSAPGCLFGAKFKAVVLDWDCIAEDMPFVRNLREGRANRNAVVLAIATDSSAKKRAAEHAAHFLLERPIEPARSVRLLRTAYGLMLQDRRRYFRLMVELGVSVRTSSGAEFKCKTINVSREGMAVSTPTPLQVGEMVDVVFEIPTPGPVMIAKGTVIWDDKPGKAGLHLSFGNSENKDRISEWLDSEFCLQLHSAQVQMQRGVEYI